MRHRNITSTFIFEGEIKEVFFYRAQVVALELGSMTRLFNIGVNINHEINTMKRNSTDR